MGTEPGRRGIVVVTGGSRGIGATTAVAVAHAGWSVLIAYRHEAQAAAGVVDSIRTAGGDAWSMPADMAKLDDISAVFEEADKLGTVTALVANAGIAARQARVDELTAERIQEMFAVNVTAPILACGHAVRRCRLDTEAPAERSFSYLQSLADSDPQASTWTMPHRKQRSTPSASA